MDDGESSPKSHLAELSSIFASQACTKAWEVAKKLHKTLHEYEFGPLYKKGPLTLNTTLGACREALGLGDWTQDFASTKKDKD